jgi:hypothetical protein
MIKEFDAPIFVQSRESLPYSSNLQKLAEKSLQQFRSIPFKKNSKSFFNETKVEIFKNQPFTIAP